MGQKTKSKKLKIVTFLERFCFTFTFAVLFLIYTPLANLMARPLIVEEELRKADIIVVLGGGAYRNNVLNRASNERLLHGLILYRGGYAPRIIFSGGGVQGLSRKLIHTFFGVKPPEDLAPEVVEADIMNNLAGGLGVPKEDRAADEASMNTYENLRNVREYMAKNGLKSCLLVTSATHMQRAALIARKLGLRCYPAPVSDYTRYLEEAVERLSLFREVMWEYCGLAIYKLYGYI